MLNRFDVAVVGAGLIGATLAARLAQQHPKWRIALIDAQSPPTVDPNFYDSRVIALNEQGRSLLQKVGVWEALQPFACAYPRMVVWDAEGTGRVSFEAGEVNRTELGHTLESGRIQRALWQFLQQCQNVDLLCPARVCALDSLGEGGYQITLADHRKIEAQLVCAADGSNSPIRSFAGLKTREWSYQQTALVGTITTELPHQSTCWQRFMQSGPLAFLPLYSKQNGVHQSSVVWTLDEARMEEIGALNNAQQCRLLTQESEAILGEVLAFSGVQKFSLRQCHAKQYVRQGLALVGDAAHTIHPLAGQGANLGFEDVAALLIELERAQNRQLSPGHLHVLRRYQRQRQVENLVMVGAMEGLKRLFGASSIELRWLRNRALVEVNKMPLLKKSLVGRAIYAPQDEVI